MTTKPNILFILADDLGYADLSCYGRRDFTTPNIDRIAAEGMRLMQAYANSAVCTASRVALITGRYQYRLSIGLEEPLTGRSPKVGLPPAHPTLPSILKQVGYQSTLIGKWHLGSLPDFGPLQTGYDHFYGFRGGALDYYTHKSGPPSTDTEDLWDDDTKIRQNGYLTDLLANRTVGVVDAYAKSGSPFLVSRAGISLPSPNSGGVLVQPRAPASCGPAAQTATGSCRPPGVRRLVISAMSRSSNSEGCNGPPAAASAPGMSRNRWFADSSLEEAVTSELVSEPQVPCYTGKIQGISLILASGTRI